VRAARPVMKQLVRLSVGLLGAVMTVGVALASLSQGFATTTAIPSGSLVAIDAKSSGAVVVADLTNSDRLFGVAVPPDSASISLGSGSGQVQVASNGSATVFVSTSGGAIKVGDYIAVSPIAGVGQKASGRVRVIGTAGADFDGKDASATKTTIDEGGVKREVAVGQIPIQISVTTYNQDTAASYLVPSWLQSLSNTLAGKAVSPIRVLMAGLILLTAVISVTVLLYAAVRNSIISIGRNPLSRSAVFKGLLQVVGVAVVILAVAASTMFLVITR
jgi:DNA-binding transcriptional regulator YdaS (Cro superfamily)